MDLGFRDALFALPIATLLHIAEEWPEFPAWARRFASPDYSDCRYIVQHVAAVAISAATPILYAIVPARLTAYLIVTLVVGPAYFCNAIFHAGASVVSRSYCAGVVTGLVCHLPVSVLVFYLSLREGLLDAPGLAVALVCAALLHTAEVGHNVFKRW